MVPPWLIAGKVPPELLVSALEHWPSIEPMIRKPITSADCDGMEMLLIEIQALIGSQCKKSHPLGTLESYLGELVEEYYRRFQPT
jgi:hypothetical protein